MYNVCIGLSRRRRADPSVISFISLLSWETSITVYNNNNKKTVLKTKHKKVQSVAMGSIFATTQQVP